jgi:hypothetical protein
MPRNVDAFALFFIVLIVLVSGYFIDHGPMCLADGVRIGVVDDTHEIGVIAPRMPALPSPPAMPAPPKMPAMPELVRLPAFPQLPRL